MKHDPIYKNLFRYLTLEKQLNLFFTTLDYCYPECIRPAIGRNGNEPVAACCKKKYYKIYDLPHPAFDRLKIERETLYGKPADHIRPNAVSPCEYHNPQTGCMLVTHKSPVCIAFMCRESIDFIRDRYAITTYDYLGVHYALEWTLTGVFSDGQFREFKESIIAMIEKLK